MKPLRSRRTAGVLTALAGPLVIAGAAPTVVADAAATRPAAEFESHAPRGTFQKGTKTFQSYGGYFNDLGPYDVEWGFASVGASYYFVDRMSLGLEVSGFGISQPDNNAAAGSLGIVFRHHLLDDGNSSLFVDVAAAAFDATDDTPTIGSQWNYVTQTGLGMTQRLGGDSHVMAGVRFTHLSNADMEGDNHNPALNGVSFYLGLMFRL
jgi:hypothetical protein